MLSFILETKGLAAAYDAACDMIREKDAEMNRLWQSRFFEKRVLEGGVRKLWPTTEAAISRMVDLQDLDREPLPELLYCDEDGQLYPVTVGFQTPFCSDVAAPFHFASGDLVANGKVVGHVVYTDH